MDAETDLSHMGPLQEINRRLKKRVCGPGPRCRKVIFKAELSEVIAFKSGRVCALTYIREQLPKKAGEPSSKQPIELVLNHAITLADGLFELLAIEYLDMPADVTNCPVILQPTGRDSHAFAAHA